MGFVLESPRTRLIWVVPVVVVVLLVVGGVVVYRATRPNDDPDTAARTAAGVTVLVHTEEWGGDVSAAEGTEIVRPGDVVGTGAARPEPIATFGGHLAEHVPARCRAGEATSGIELEP